MKQTHFMEVINGYEKVTYPELQTEIKARLNGKKNNVEVASELGLKSVQTVLNIFNEKQIVSDDLLRKVFEVAGLKAMIIYDTTGRNYFMEK